MRKRRCCGVELPEPDLIEEMKDLVEDIRDMRFDSPPQVASVKEHAAALTHRLIKLSLP